MKSDEAGSLRTPPFWRRVLVRTIRRTGEASVANTAAAFAYYALFAVFPLFALILSVGTLFFDPQAVMETLREFVPVGGQEEQIIWQGVLSLQSVHGGINTAFFLVFLWAGLRFFQALVHGVNQAWHLENLPWWQLSVKNLAMVFAVLLGVLFGVMVPAILQVAKQAALVLREFFHLPFPDDTFLKFLNLADGLRYALGLGFLFYAICILYLLAPRKRRLFRRVWPFALGVSLLLQAGQTVFVKYVPMFIHYNAIYGTVGGVMFLLLWIYVAGYLILSGACACAAWEEESAPSLRKAHPAGR